MLEAQEAVKAASDEELAETVEQLTVLKEAYQNALDDLALDQQEKIEQIALVIKNEQATVEAIKVEEQRLAKRRQACENTIKWWKECLLQNMQATECRKVETTKAVVRLRKNPASAVFDDEEAFLINAPDRFKRVKVEIRRSDVTRALKNGETVEGAHLEQKESVTIG